MATADLSFDMKITGTPQEVVSILEIMFEYNGGKDGVYFSATNAKIGDKTYFFSITPKDEILSAASSSSEPVEISSLGPFGKYYEIDDVDIFREMAQAAPCANFTASITGFAGYADQSITAELVDGLLHISTYYLSDDVRGEAELAYYSSYLPYEKFISLFKLDSDLFDTELYEDFILCNVTGHESVGEFFEETDYEDFIDLFEDGECSLTEEEYQEIAQQFIDMDYELYEIYLEKEGYAQCQDYTYDPIEEKYLDADHPRLKAGVTYDITDDIRTYLQSIGHPSDDETIDALSVDDVYAIMAGTYGKELLDADDECENDDDAEVVDEAICTPEAEECEGGEEECENAEETDVEDTESDADEAEVVVSDITETAEAEEVVEAETTETEPAETECCKDEAIPEIAAPKAAETAPAAENKAAAPKKAAPVWLIVLLVAIILIALGAFVFSLNELLTAYGIELLNIAARLL